MRHILIMALLIGAVGLMVLADESQSAISPLKISISCSDEEIAKVFQTIGVKGQVAILLDPGVKGKITMNLNDRTVEEALGIICKSNKLEFVKVYATDKMLADASNAGKIFALLETIKAIGTDVIGWEDKVTGMNGIFAPAIGPEAGQFSVIVNGLKLTPAYLVRAEPEPTTAKQTEATAQASQIPLSVELFGPGSDPRATAQSLWGYINQMLPDQQRQVIRELGRIMRERIPSDQRNNMRRHHERWERGPEYVPIPPGF